MLIQYYITIEEYEKVARPSCCYYVILTNMERLADSRIDKRTVIMITLNAK